jgi:hypothetical protein
VSNVIIALSIAAVILAAIWGYQNLELSHTASWGLGFIELGEGSSSFWHDWALQIGPWEIAKLSKEARASLDDDE